MRVKRARSTRGWERGVGLASEASKKNREAVDTFRKKKVELLPLLSPCH